MKLYIAAAFSLLVVSVVPATAQQRLSQQDAMKIAETFASTAEVTYAKQDAAAFAKLYTNDTTFLPASTPVSKGGMIAGRDGVRKFFAVIFQQGLDHASLKVAEAHPIGRSSIWTVGEMHLSGQHEGRPLQINARFGQVLVRSGNTWQARMMIVSGDPPPAGAPPGGPPP